MALQQPPQITIKDIPSSDAVEEHIREEIDKISQRYGSIISCHVLVEPRGKNKQQGKLHNVRIRIGIPNKELAANHDEEENLYLCIRQTFDSMKRQLDEYFAQLRNKVKSHRELVQGEIARLFSEGRYGFIVTPATDEDFYFNSDNLVSHLKFEQLEVGMPVQFVEAVGTDGPQAHRVSASKRQRKE